MYNGNNPTTGSYVRENGNNVQDSCATAVRVAEMTCSSGDLVLVPQNCNAGDYCFDIAQGDACHTSVSCEDGDGGNVYMQKSSVTVKDAQGNEVVKEDSCSGGMLIEFACNSATTYTQSTVNCENSLGSGATCSNGKCVAALGNVAGSGGG